MYEGRMSKKLSELIKNYQERFKDDLDNGFSLFYTTLSHDELVSRLERAITEGKPYDPMLEEWDDETRKAAESGDIVI